MKRGVFWTLISVILLASISTLVYLDYDHYMSSPISREKLDKPLKVVINRGATLTQVAATLQERGVIASPTYFRAYLLINEVADKVRAGVYHFQGDETPKEIALELIHGPNTPFVVVTIKEGYNIWQVAEAFEETGLATADEVMELMTDREFAAELKVPQGPRADQTISLLEGYLFPETYYVEPGQSLRNIIARMVQQSYKELRAAKKRNIEEYSHLLEKVGLSDHDLITLASMVERETALPHEKHLVASVFLNRLHKSMLFQTDPTLTYTPEKRGGVPTPEDRKNEDNPYNTYVFEGFPPGPICSPGRTSIEAAVAPANSAFLFFVAKRDGTGGHHFTTNYDDHRRAVRKYLRKGK